MTEPLVGIDVGGTKCLGVALGANGERVAEHRVPTPRGATALVDALAAIATELGGSGPVGLGVPGLVNRDGVLLAAPNIVDVRNLALKDLLEQRLGREVFVDNDNTCGALAEWTFGAGRGVDDMILVGLGTGIGGGQVCGGVLQRGANGFAGEIGHMVIDTNGPPCGCGRRGCWEQFASGSGLAYLGRQAAEHDLLPSLVNQVGGIDRLRGEHIRDAALEGHPGAVGVIDTFARWVALGLVNLTNIFDPALIVLSGGVAANPDLYLPPIRRWFDELLFAGMVRPRPTLVFAELGTYACAVGAALLSDAGGSSREPR